MAWRKRSDTEKRNVRIDLGEDKRGLTTSGPKILLTKTWMILQYL